MSRLSSLFAFLLLCSSTTWAVPTRWQDHTALDRQSNVSRRMARGEVITAGEQADLPLWVIHIPLKADGTSALTEISIETTSLGTDDYSHSETAAFVARDQNGSPVELRLFITDAPGLRFDLLKRTLRSKGARLTRSTARATKFQSHATYLAHDQEGQGTRFIKMSYANSNGTVGNGPEFARSAVRLSSVLEQWLPQNSFLKESFAACISINTVAGQAPLHYCMSTRDTSMIERSFLEPAQWLPAHGFLGSGRISHENFRTQFLPAFARYLADLHWNHGIYPEMHSQNLLVKVNRTTGAIEDFAFRDTADVMLDPFTRIHRNLPVTSAALKGQNVSLVNFFHVQGTSLDGKRDNSDPAWNMVNYALQVAWAFVTDVPSSMADAAAFANAYIAACESMTGYSVVLTTEAQRILLSLQEGRTLPEYAAGRTPEKYHALFSSIYESITRQRLAVPAAVDTGYDQLLLARLFYERYFQQEEVALPLRAARLRFMEDDLGDLVRKRKILFGLDRASRIVAFDRASGQLLAVAYGLRAGELIEISRGRKRAKMVNVCAGHLLR